MHKELLRERFNLLSNSYNSRSMSYGRKFVH